VTLEFSEAVDILASDFVARHPGEAAAELEELPPAELAAFFGAESSKETTAVMEAIRPEVSADLVLHADPETRTRWISAMSSSKSAVILSRLDEETRAEILRDLRPGLAREISEIMSYPPETAGSIMDPQVSHYRFDTTVESALARLRGLRHLRINNLYVVDNEGTYTGSVRIQDLALADPDQRLRELVAGTPVSVRGVTPRAEVVELLEQTQMPTVPVVDFEGRLIGVIRYDAVLSAVEAEVSANIQAMVGASRDERALSPVTFAVRKRLPWLQINLLTAFLASFVVGLFEDTIAQYTALAILLPVVAGQSGNTGAQALAVTMRGLALREISFRTDSARVALKEVGVAAVNGVAVALVTAAAVFVWSRSAGLAAVIGIAMVVSMIIAGLAGATIPMILTMLGQDPAQASSIVLTTVTDVAGFLSFLGLATLFVNLL
jgi:magnesium transporter